MSTLVVVMVKKSVILVVTKNVPMLLLVALCQAHAWEGIDDDCKCSMGSLPFV